MRKEQLKEIQSIVEDAKKYRKIKQYYSNINGGHGTMSDVDKYDFCETVEEIINED